MLYYFDRVVNGTETKLVVLARTPDGQMVTYKQILGSEILAGQLINYGDRTQLIIDREGNTPLLSVGPHSASTVAVTQMINIFQSKGDVVEQVTAMMQKQGKDDIFPLEVTRKIFELTGEFNGYILGKDPFRISIPPLFYTSVECAEVLQLHNGRLGDRPSYMGSLNKTNYMSTPDDLFYIRLPDYDKLQSEDFPISYFIPKESDIAAPYPHPIYSTPFIRTALDGSPIQVKNAIAELAARVPLSAEQKSGIPPLDRKFLLGQDSNNNLGIESNEEEFRDALRELIRYDIKQHTRDVSDEGIDKIYQGGQCSLRLLEYLRDLVIFFSKMNWSHNGRFPISISAESDEYDDEDDNDNESTTASVTDSMNDSRSYYDLGDNTVIDGLDIVLGFITNAVLSCGMDAYVEAIIKLARWGHRKPTILKVCDFSQYLDLNDVKVVTSLGSIDFSEPTDVDGYEMELVGLVVFEGRIGDRKYILDNDLDITNVSAPVALMLYKYYGTEYQTVFMSITDALELYRDGNNEKLIKGINLVDGKPVFSNPSDLKLTTLRQADEVVRKATNKSFVYYINESMKDIMLGYEVKDLTDLNTLLTFVESERDLTRWYPLLEFHNKQELAAKMAEVAVAPMMFFKANMAQILVPLYLEVTREFQETYGADESKLFEAYETAIRRNEFSSSLAFLEEVKQTTHVAETKEEKPATSTAFTKEEEVMTVLNIPEATVELTPESIGFELMKYLIYPIQEGEAIYALKEGDQTVAGFSVVKSKTTGKDIYRLVGATKVPANAAVSSSKFTDLTALVFAMLTGVLGGKVDAVNVVFSDVSDLTEFSRFFKG